MNSAYNPALMPSTQSSGTPHLVTGHIRCDFPQCFAYMRLCDSRALVEHLADDRHQRHHLRCRLARASASYRAGDTGRAHHYAYRFYRRWPACSQSTCRLGPTISSVRREVITRQELARTHSQRVHRASCQRLPRPYMEALLPVRTRTCTPHYPAVQRRVRTCTSLSTAPTLMTASRNVAHSRAKQPIARTAIAPT